MKFIGDFHIHSKYSRATSPLMNPQELDKWAKMKGIKVMATGDFTHPLYFKELKEKLIEKEPGLYIFKDTKEKDPTRFILTVEISNIYSKNGKVRKIHNLIFAPSLQVAEKINNYLSMVGNLKADGRPILGLDCKEMLKKFLDISSDILFVPAHAWTPWFAIFGSMSGFDSIEECFEDYSKYIYAIETGLSSDAPMNWRLSALDKITLISNSDSHSAPKIGREANVFDATLSYKAILDAIKNKDPKKFLYTIEFFPQEGKYHYDGHRACKVCLNPKETIEKNYLCPKCSRPVTVGVMQRVEKLADRPEGFKPENVIPYKNLIPLEEIIAEALNVGVASKKVKELWLQLINHFGNEFFVLLEAGQKEIEASSLPEIAEGVARVREGKVKIEPGYDGEYGNIKIFQDSERKQLVKQKSLF